MPLQVKKLNEQDLGYTIRKSDKAKRVVLRVHPRTQEIELVVPKRVSIAYAMEFAAAQTDWIERQKAKKTDTIPLLANDVKQLKKDARKILTNLVMEKIRLLPERARAKPLSPLQGLFDFMNPSERWSELDVKIRIGDMQTRWGSCHPDGRISFSWRLMLAPEHARDYVVAHEVAHLVHHNHSQRFWDLCEKLSVDFNGGYEWMKRHGSSLQSYLVTN